MRRAFSLFTIAVLVGFCWSCGSAPELDGVTLGDIQFEGDHAEAIASDLKQALTAAGATVGQPSGPDLLGTLTWEWAGEGDTPYPTLVKVFIQSEPKQRRFTVTTRYAVAEGAQPRDVAHYRAEIVDRIVGRIAAQNREAS